MCVRPTIPKKNAEINRYGRGKDGVVQDTQDR